MPVVDTQVQSAVDRHGAHRQAPRHRGRAGEPQRFLAAAAEAGRVREHAQVADQRGIGTYRRGEAAGQARRAPLDRGRRPARGQQPAHRVQPGAGLPLAGPGLGRDLREQASRVGALAGTSGHPDQPRQVAGPLPAPLRVPAVDWHGDPDGAAATAMGRVPLVHGEDQRRDEQVVDRRVRAAARAGRRGTGTDFSTKPYPGRSGCAACAAIRRHQAGQRGQAGPVAVPSGRRCLLVPGPVRGRRLDRARGRAGGRSGLRADARGPHGPGRRRRSRRAGPGRRCRRRRRGGSARSRHRAQVPPPGSAAPRCSFRDIGQADSCSRSAAS